MVTDLYIIGYDRSAELERVDVLVEHPPEDGRHVTCNDKVHGAVDGEHDVGDGGARKGCVSILIGMKMKKCKIAIVVYVKFAELLCK